MIITILSLILFSIVILIFRFRYNKKFISKGIHKLFEPFARFLIKRIKFISVISPKEKICKAVNIHRGTFNILSVVYSLEVIFIVLILSIFAINNDKYVDGNKILKPDYNQSDKNLDIIYETEGEEGSINLGIKKKKMTLKEIENSKEKIREQIGKKLLGTNIDFNNIVDKLNFFTNINSIDASVFWEYDSELFDIDGNPKADITEDIHTTLTAKISNKEIEFSETYDVKIPKSNEIGKNLNKYIKDDENYINLPENIGDKKITWKYEKGENGVKALFISIVSAIGFIFIKFRHINEKYKNREFELQKEYPYLVGLLVLYMETGLSISQAWRKICKTYNDKSLLKVELLQTENFMKNGKSMDEVFGYFASSCNTKEYRKLSQLITQNLKRGSATILNILRQEMYIVEKNRMSFAKIMAKKAETKLLIPLMIMLLLVFIIILAPSLLSFKI